MIAKSECIECFDKFSVWEIGRDRAMEVTRLVFEVYFARFSRKYEWEGEYEKMALDDQVTLEKSRIYAALSKEDGLLGTIRLIEKMDQDLPIEKDFHLNVFDICREKQVNPTRIFEIGRFAKDPVRIKNAGIVGRQRLAVIDELIAQGIYTSSRESGNVWVASIDVSVLALLRSRGLQFSEIGKTKMDYLGSPTVPVCLPVDECRDYMRGFNHNRYLKYFQPMIETVSCVS